MKCPLIVPNLLTLVVISLTGCEYLTESQAILLGSSHSGEHSLSHDVENTHPGDHESQAGQGHGAGGHHAVHKLLVTSSVRKDVVSTRQYVCQIHSCKHIEVRALEGGYLEDIRVQEGQMVRKGDRMFKILPTLYEAKLESEAAEAQRVKIELDNAESLADKGIVSPQELAIKRAELAKAQANVQLAQAELEFTNVKAPFDGIIDRLHEQLGSLVEEGDILTTLSDNSVMWVYFNVPETSYLEYIAELQGDDDDDGLDRDDEDDDEEDEDHELQIELKLANGKIFAHPGRIGAIEADFNNETGNIAFRADFPNPSGMLRHGQTGTILLHRDLDDVVVIPQRATYEILAKRYVYVVDDHDIIHQREIEIETELEDIFVIKSGLDAGEKIVLEGIRQVRDGDKVEYEYSDPIQVLQNLKYHAE